MEYRSTLSERAQPVHGRSLEIEIFNHGPDRVKVKGVIVDLRKQGFVPTGGDLQASGIIHHMLLDAVVRRSDLMLESLEPLQPIVAYEPSEATGGESCRDIAWRIPELVGRPLDTAFAKWLQAGFGGPLGCSHLLALAHLLGSTTPQALSRDAELFPADEHARGEGERIFKRSLVLDGFELIETGRLQIMALLNDIYTRPQEEAHDLLDRLAFQRELRFWGEIGMPSMSFDVLESEQRKRSSLTAADWEDLSPLLSPLLGVGAMQGLSHRVLDLFSERPDMQPLQDILLSVGPALIQCLGSMAGRMAENQPGQAAAPISALGGMNNSCYLWRVGGPGLRHRDAHMKAFDVDS
ncbi:MAG: DUF2889 domain-containing protein [Myxococcota bacterium]|nr:DUF2889 domain-containing protein [Myxococcota bacterium]